MANRTIEAEFEGKLDKINDNLTLIQEKLNVTHELARVLALIVYTPTISVWLEDNKPKVFQQAVTALENYLSAGGSTVSREILPSIEDFRRPVDHRGRPIIHQGKKYRAVIEREGNRDFAVYGPDLNGRDCCVARTFSEFDAVQFVKNEE